MLTSLRLRNFRCYTTLSWDIPVEGAILLGKNAQGKTSLLEALCFALSLHSPRASRLDRLSTEGSGNFGLSLSGDEGMRRLVWENRRLLLTINGAPCKDYGDYLEDAPPVTWLGNRDVALVQGSAEERRRYLDFLGVQWHPGYRNALQQYRRALKARNALLRYPRRNRATLHSYASLLALHGALLMDLRRQLLQRLQPHVIDAHARIAGQSELVSLTYMPSANGSLEEALNIRLEQDERAGYTTVGPHRDDFLLSIQGKAAAEYASEGQQRTLATALQFAQASLLQVETGHTPILLVDDIFGELDPERRKALLALLPQDAQVFITTTHLDWLRGEQSPFPIQRIEGGRLVD